MSKRLRTNDSPLNLLDLDAIAKHTSFIRRKTQSFSGISIILALLKCLQKGDASFNLLAGEMRLLNLKSTL
ncbi:MAG: hypothetical protein ABGY95_02490 [Rubritalea sp.]|uniref:hypothetical protein n=1 Tax=Rubritalea sp. TaxID=2109375 RepID=UPI00324227E7